MAQPPVTLFNQVTGKPVTVSRQEATELLRDPAYLVSDTSEFTIVDPYGQKFGAKGGDIYKWLSDPGFRLETEAEEHQRFLDQEYGGIGGAAAAGVLGAARGVTLGISDIVADAAGYGNVVADIAEASPVISTVAEIAGGVGAGIASGGTSIAGRTAAKALAMSPAGLAVKGGAAAATAVENALRAGTSLEKGAVLLGKATGMAAEGAAFAGGMAVSERLLGDPEAAAVDILADWASGAATGAAFGGVLGFAAGIPTLTKRMGKVFEAAPTQANDEGLRAMLSEVTGRELSPEAVSAWTKTTARLRKAAVVMKHGRSSKRAAEIYEELLTDPLKREAAVMENAVEKALDDVLPLWTQADEAFNAAIYAPSVNKAERVARIADEVIPMSTGAAVGRFAGPTNTLRKVLNEARERALSVEHKVVADDLRIAVKRLEQIEKRFGEEVAKLPDGQAGRAALKYLDEVGEELNTSLTKWSKTPQFKERPDEYLKVIRAARAELVGSLTSPELFGKAAATKMSTLRQAAGKTLNSRDIVRSRFTAKMADDVFGQKRVWNPKRIKTLLKQISDDPDKNLDVASVLDYFQSARHQIRTNRELLKLTGEEAALYNNAEKALDKLLDRFQQWKKVAKNQSDFKVLSKLTGASEYTKGSPNFASLLKMGGAFGFGNTVAGPGGAFGMWVMGSMLGTISQPATHIKNLAQLGASRQAMKGRISAAVSGLMGKKSAAVAPVVGQIAAAARPDVTPSRAVDIMEVLEGLQQVAAAGPEVLPDMAAQFGPMANLAPETVAQMASLQKRGAEFLVREAARLGLERKPGRFFRPPAAVLSEWRKLHEAVNNPVGAILNPLARGHFSREAEKVLKEVYPQLLATLRDAAWEELEKRPVVDLSTAKKLSRILGIPLDDALSPDVVRVLQNAQRVLNPAEQATAPSSGRPSEIPLTTAQRLESK